MNIYTQYIQGFSQSRFSTTDHALSLVACDLNSILLSSYIAYPYPRKCFFITRIHGNVFRKELVSKNPSPWKRVCQRVP
jgi:hypothetical protein